MKSWILRTTIALSAISMPLMPAAVSPARAQKPIVDESVVFAESDGLVAVEAEHFFKQTSDDVRAFYLTHSDLTPDVQPDGDPNHVGGASGGAYLEILPDTRRTHDDKLIKGENFSPTAGEMAILHYNVHVSTPGRYYVWVRAHSTGPEDNGLHVGIDGQWPESGQRLQWCEGKRTWRWDSKQRTESVHCGEPYKIYLDVAEAGNHVIHFSMREDGFEFDKWLMTTEREFERPDGVGPKSQLHAGQRPKAFPFVKAPTKPAIAMAQPDASNHTPAPKLQISASEFALAGTGYYLDKGKWLAINPERNKQAEVQTAFPFPSGRYDVTLAAVGEEDGQSTYQLSANDAQIGKFKCPLSDQQFEEGSQFTKTWKGITIDSGDVLTLASQIASADGQEYSRARVARLVFQPADNATRSAVASMKPANRSSAPDQTDGPPQVLPRKADGDGSAVVSGEQKQWHKVTLTVDGPYAHEGDNEPNAFTDLALNVTFEHESGSPSYSVPGYFAADGDAANSSAESGTKWRAHLSPDKAGVWNYKVSFRSGPDAAIDGGGQPVKPFDGITGSFEIAKTDKQGPDFRAQGRLEYVGQPYLQFAGSKTYFLKAGPDAPETMLGYADFDNTVAGKPDKVALKTWQPHAKDWNSGDPTWKDGKGKGLIGALNYLKGKGLNAFSFLTYNAGGDGDNVWPFVSRNDKLHYDCSKLDQWGHVFDHATASGLYLHFKMQENEMDDDRRGHAATAGNIPESLDGGKLGPQRKLYCRELIARYGHALALNWNIGEENTQSSQEIRDMVKYLHDTDPYHHHIVIHTFPSQQEKVYRPLLGDQSLLTGVSLQNSWSDVHRRTLQWRNESASAGRPWVVANDEQNPASAGVPADPGYQGKDGTAPDKGGTYNLHDIRKHTLWGNLMAGGAGVEYYFGYKLPENDLICEDFRSRDRSWDYCRHALEFFPKYDIPFWEMSNADALVGNDQNENSTFCFAKPGEIYLVYLSQGGTTKLDLSEAKGDFTVQWYNPRAGGNLVTGTSKSVSAGGAVEIGSPPADTDQDWLAVIRK